VLVTCPAENDPSTCITTRPDHELVGVQGAPLKLLGASKVEVTFHGLERKFLTDVQVAESITTEFILGRDFLQRNRCAVEMGVSINFASPQKSMQYLLARERIWRALLWWR